MKLKEVLRSRKFQKRTLITAVVLILLIAVVGFLVLPHVLKPLLAKKISESLHRQVSIAKIARLPQKGISASDRSC